MINNLNKVRFYRCTQLARKSQRDNFYQNLSMALGTHLHKALAVKHSQLWPTRHHEQEQICLFSYKGYIKSLLGGTPDMFWTEADTLYVVDYKTKKDTSKTKTQSAWWSQLAIYALLILTNSNEEYNEKEKTWAGIKNISMEIWTYEQKETIEESILKTEDIFSSKATTADIWEATRKFIKEAVGKDWEIVPFSKARVVL